MSAVPAAFRLATARLNALTSVCPGRRFENMALRRMPVASRVPCQCGIPSICVSRSQGYDSSTSTISPRVAPRARVAA